MVNLQEIKEVNKLGTSRDDEAVNFRYIIVVLIIDVEILRYIFILYIELNSLMRNLETS